MNTGRVGEGAGTDDRFVGRNRHIADLAHGLAGTPDFLVINAGVHIHNVFAHFDGHDHLFQRAVTGAFADTVHRAFHLTSAGVDRGEGVTDRDAQVVMGMDGDDGFVDIGDVFVQTGDNVGEFERHGVADGIRNIDGRCACINRGFNNASQIGDRRTASVFTGKLDIVSVVTRAFHHIDRPFDNFIQVTAQLGRDMHRRGGDKGVNTERFCDF